MFQTVPHGVLVFLSSYKMLDKLQKRWEDTGVYHQLCEYKEVMSEPRGGDRSVDFDELMGEFYACISRTEHVGKDIVNNW